MRFGSTVNELSSVWALSVTYINTALKALGQNSQLRVPIGSAGRVGIPCTEGLSSMQLPWVRVPAWGCMSPCFLPFLAAVLSTI